MDEQSRERRTRGRPWPESTDVGRQVLIDVARQVFSTVDPATVTRQMIAKAAAVDPNLIRYYFGNMQHLAEEVLFDTHRKARAEMSAMRKQNKPLERLFFRIERIFHIFNDNPNHHKLVMAVLYQNEKSMAHQEWVSILRESLDDLTEIIDIGVKRGLMRRCDPRLLHMVIISACEFWAANGHVVNIFFSKQEVGKSLNETYVGFIYDTIMNGIKPKSKE